MFKKSKTGVTLIELLVVFSVVGLLGSILSVWAGGSRAEARDTKRVAEVDTLRKALELYYHTHGSYPEATNWIKIEEDVDNSGPFSLVMRPYLSEMPRDPLFPKIEETRAFSYQYKSTQDRQGYKIHVSMESGKYAFHEVYAGGGDAIIHASAVVGAPTPPTDPVAPPATPPTDPVAPPADPVAPPVTPPTDPVAPPATPPTDPVAPPATPPGPPAGHALGFDGVDDHIEIPNSPSLNVADALTMVAWIKPFGTSPNNTWRTVVGKQSNAKNGGYHLFFVDESFINPANRRTVVFHVQTSGAAFVAVNLPEYDRWYHVVATFDRNQCGFQLYLNGVFQGEFKNCGSGALTSPIRITDKALYAGGDPINDSAARHEFNGVIDEVRIYNRALTAVEAREHFEGIFTNETGLVGRWNFNEGSESVAADGSGSGNHGTLFNNPQWVVAP